MRLAMSSLLYVALCMPCTIFAQENTLSAEILAATTPQEVVAGETGVTVVAAVLEAGPGELYYSAGHIEAFQFVKVISVTSQGWYKIIAPEGSESWLKLSAVEIEGNMATVLEDRTECFAAGSLGAESSFRMQSVVDGGTQLQVVEVVGDYVRVEAPENAFLYVHADTLRPATVEEVLAEQVFDGTPAETGAEAPAEDPPAEEPVEEPVVDEPEENLTPEQIPEPAPVDPEPVDDGLNSIAEAPAVRLTDHRYRLAFQESDTLTLAEIELLLQEVGEHLQTELSPIDQAIMSRHQRVLNIKREQVLIEQRVEAEAQAVSDAIGEHNTEPEQVVDTTYVAIGRLQASPLYNGEELPNLYVLVDPATDATIGYLSPNQLENPGQYIGRLVGVRGTIQMDPALRLRIITPDSVDLLTNEQAAQAAE